MKILKKKKGKFLEKSAFKKQPFVKLL